MNPNKSITKEVTIFFLIAFGMTYLMGIPLAISQRAGLNTDAFPSAQMMYPAAGAILGLMATRHRKRPKKFYILYLLATLVMIGCAVSVPFVRDANWMMVCNAVIIAGSVLAWPMLLLDKKENRASFGLCWHGGVKALGYVALFILLRTLSVFLSVLPSGQLGEYLQYWATPAPWLIFVMLIPNFFLSFLAFFGEEYGWRYYLQPKMQKRFGPRRGVLLLGLLWGFWHLPLNLFYYSTETSLQSFVGQIITCITLGIFFAWAYLKTQNIWIPVLLHYFNNNLIVVYTASAELTGQVISWADIGILLVINLVLYMPSFASRVFNTLPQEPAVSEQADTL